MSQHESLVTIHLVDFIIPNLDTLYSDTRFTLLLLVNKLRAPLRVGFSNRFIHCGQIPSANKERPGCPDVKISYHLNCIIIVEYYDQCIQFYELYSKQKLSAFRTVNPPRCLCVEENYDGQQNDALIFDCDCDGNLYKYDVKALIQNGNNCSPIWIQNVQGGHILSGITISRNTESFSEKFIYVASCGSDSVIILKASNGQQVGKISKISSPCGIDITEKGELIVSTLNGLVQLFTQRALHTFESKVVLSKGVFDSPRGICYDPVAKTIIICDTMHYVMVVMDLEGNILKSFEDRKILSYPYGVCVNSLNGELFISNWSLEGVQLFK
ncbi:hypothetical protein C9374_007582 [Naegleria lovaniensis]|uniref:Uncharacterized protein n=1 Tax=Naegleria lovaniensis TaxID=51637 RepID=A0AA88KLI2_NAELO|nr:uncharacterized protein C9374_007582 [Naegleria lovaniensis]KAG2378944.1 hypothetical protein C9374_007582 [Naegleria lovaniensis]